MFLVSYRYRCVCIHAAQSEAAARAQQCDGLNVGGIRWYIIMVIVIVAKLNYHRNLSCVCFETSISARFHPVACHSAYHAR